MSKPIELLTKPEFLTDLKDDRMTQRAVADKWSVAPSTVSKWRNRIKEADGLPTQVKVAELTEEKEAPEGQRVTWTGTEGELAVVIHEDMTHENILKKFGHDPENVRIVGVLEETHWQFGTGTFNHRYRFKTERRDPVTGLWAAPDTQYPLWPVIQPVTPREAVEKYTVPRVFLTRKWKTAILMADNQYGFRLFEDGTYDPFHDDAAIDVAIQIVDIENPDRVVVMGDIIDLQEQGRWAQEAAFANTTQKALDATYGFGVELREATNGDIDFIEGNHEKRMQNFIETNAKSAFGLKMAGMPESWPVMSLPNLLRLDELGITYHDAYPTAHVWINNTLRAEHGTKVNSNGSTGQKYMNETPHISRAFGHTHRLEAISRTTYDRAGKIRSMAINPGCLCRVDGAVPGVHGAIGINGRPAQVFEDWQQGIAVVRYTDDDFRVDLVQIEDGMTVYQGEEINAR